MNNRDHPAEPVGVSDEAVTKALDGWCSVPTYGTYSGQFDAMRAALEAAQPLLGTRPQSTLDRNAVPVADWPGLDRSPAASAQMIQWHAPETFAAVLAVRPLPTREQIAEALRDHYPTTGMSVTSGVTCQCGYWNGDESPGNDRPAGAQGRDGLNWHRAQVVAALFTGGKE